MKKETAMILGTICLIILMLGMAFLANKYVQTKQDLNYCTNAYNELSLYKDLNVKSGEVKLNVSGTISSFDNNTTPDFILSNVSFLSNYSPRFIVNCNYYKGIEDMSYFEIESFQWWIYSQCAMVEVNPNLYDKSFKEYHVCFKFEVLNKSVGYC